MELLRSRMPAPDEVQTLELSPGVPVVQMLHIDYDAEGRTLQVADDLYAADRHEFAFEWWERVVFVSEWRRDWAELTRGIGCEMCESGRPDANEYGIRIHAGQYTDAYLQRADVQRGYTVVIWRGRHVNEPTDLTEEEAAGYWAEVLAVARALISNYEPLKMNYETLGNSVPHLHTHLVPRYTDDPRPGEPFPLTAKQPDAKVPESRLRGEATILRKLLGYEQPSARS